METAIENQYTNDMQTKLDEEKLKSLLNEDKKNLFAMDTIETANIFLHWDEERLAEEINSGSFLPRIVYELGETNSELCKTDRELRDMSCKVDEMADIMLDSEEERLKYLRFLKPLDWMVSRKLDRGMKLTDEEAKFVKGILASVFCKKPF